MSTLTFNSIGSPLYESPTYNVTAGTTVDFGSITLFSNEPSCDLGGNCLASGVAYSIRLYFGAPPTPTQAFNDLTAQGSITHCQIAQCLPAGPHTVALQSLMLQDQVTVFAYSWQAPIAGGEVVVTPLPDGFSLMLAGLLLFAALLTKKNPRPHTQAGGFRWQVFRLGNTLAS